MLCNRRDEWLWQHNLHRAEATEVLHSGLINWHTFTLSDELKSIPCSENVKMINSCCPWKHLLKRVCNNKRQWSVPQQPCIHFKSINQFKSMHLKVLSLLVRKTTQIKLWSSLLYSIRAHNCDLPHLVELGTSIQEIATVKRISSECLKITYPDVQVSG